MKDPSLKPAWVDHLTLRIHEDSESTMNAIASATPSAHQPKVDSIASKSEDCNPTRSSPRSLATLQSLSPLGTILLLTPVMLPAAFSKVSRNKDSSDPFEALGRVVSQQHNRVRHVPYVPSVGYTETHDIFVRQADAVIVLTCQPNNPPREGLARHLTVDESVARQSDFAESVVNALDVANSETKEIPLVLIRFGDVDGQNLPSAYENVIQVKWLNQSSVKQIVQLLFNLTA